MSLKDAFSKLLRRERAPVSLAPARSAEVSSLYELPLNKSLRNGWTATAVYYKDKSEDALVQFEENKSGRTVFTVLRTPWGDMARFDANDRTPALQNAPGMAVDFAADLANIAIRGNKSDREARKNSGPTARTKASRTPKSGPALREIPFHYHLPNGWRAEKVSYFDRSSAATVFFSHEDGKRTCMAGVDLCENRGGLARIIDSSAPAFHDVPPKFRLLDKAVISGLEVSLGVTVEMDKLNRISHEKACAAVAKIKPGVK